jgi:uncharacterized LabA/DUF88 family protein
MIKVLVAIDQANLHGQLKQIGKKADFVWLREILINPQEDRFEIDTYIYAPVPQQNADGVFRWHDWLRSQGFVVVSKRAKQLPDGSSKCNLDSELILDVLEICNDVHPDVVVLVSGDGDFASLCHRLRRKGIRVEVASIEGNIAAELRFAAHRIIDLTQWAECCEAIQ